MNDAVRAGKVSAVANVFLTIFKALAGVAVNSTALIADALHSLIDVIGSVLVWIGIKVAQKPPNKLYPYGRFKAESLAELGVGLIIIFTSLTIAYEAVEELISGTSPKFEFYALAVALISALVNEGLARYKIRVGVKTRSTSLVAEGKHSRTDAISSLSVFIGFLLVRMGYWWADALVAIVISVLILQVGFKIVKNAIDVLMDKVDVTTSLLIRREVEDIEGVEGVDFIAVRGTQKAKIVEVHVKVKSNLPHEDVERILKRVEGIKDKIPGVIHVVPVLKFYKEVRVVALPVDKDNNYVGDLSAEYFYIVDLRSGEKKIVENVYRDAEKRRGYLISGLLEKNNVDLVVVKKIGEGAKAHLRSRGIDYMIIDGKSVEEVLEKVKSKLIKSEFKS